MIDTDDTGDEHGAGSAAAADVANGGTVGGAERIHERSEAVVKQSQQRTRALGQCGQVVRGGHAACEHPEGQVHLGSRMVCVIVAAGTPRLSAAHT